MYTLLMVGLGVALSQLLAGPAYLAGQVINLLLWISFCLPVSFLDKSAEKNKDDAYLYYLGISGLRMLLYMVGIALTIYLVPLLRDRAMVLLLTTGFILYTGVEVTAFMRKLREIFRSNP
jgi:hypothetical protein